MEFATALPKLDDGHAAWMTLAGTRPAFWPILATQWHERPPLKEPVFVLRTFLVMRTVYASIPRMVGSRSANAKTAAISKYRFPLFSFNELINMRPGNLTHPPVFVGLHTGFRIAHAL